MSGGLLSIAPLREIVHGVEVVGVGLEGIAHLFNVFPELRMLISGKEVEAKDLVALAPQAIDEIIAAGIGMAGDPEQVAAAKGLSLEMKVDFLEAILRLTMPKGVGPFAERVSKLAGVFGGGPSLQDTNLPKPPKR